jgi:hypothetical protein
LKIEESKLDEEIRFLEKDLLSNLAGKSRERMGKSIVRVNNRQELLKASQEGKIVLMNFCKRLECSEELKEGTRGYEIRGRRVDVVEQVWGKCAWCSRDAIEVAVVAKTF